MSFVYNVNFLINQILADKTDPLHNVVNKLFNGDLQEICCKEINRRLTLNNTVDGLSEIYTFVQGDTPPLCG